MTNAGSMGNVVNLKPPLSPFMSRHEVADYLRIHPNSVDKLAREGILTRHRIEGLSVLLYRRDEVKSIVVEQLEHPDSNISRRRRAQGVERRTAPEAAVREDASGAVQSPTRRQGTITHG